MERPDEVTGSAGADHRHPLSRCKSGYVPRQIDAVALSALLQTWREGDAEEQRQTFEYLKRVLDEDRLSERKLFP